VKTISAIPPGIKKLIDDWTKRYARATLEEQVLMGTELVGQIEAFIVTFALAGTKAGQASTLGVRGGGTGVKVGAGGVAALSKAAVVSIPAVVPKTVAEAAVVATMMASMGSKGGAPPALGAGGGSPGKPETGVDPG
jgi:hypothetical protein